MPGPPTAITRGPTFAHLLRRECELAFYIEDEFGDRKQSLVFFGVQAYKFTHLAALSVEMIEIAYGRLVDLIDSAWLEEVSRRATKYYNLRNRVTSPLRHLAICFDDGPYFEFICEGFRPHS